MKELTVVRHAKSSWKDTALRDHDRPLNKRGKHNAPDMGQRLAKRGFSIDLIVSSPAVRARTTAEIIAREIGYPVADIVHDERVYDASLPDLMTVVRGLPDAHDRIMLFGHNPAFTQLVRYLSGHHLDNLPTCGIGQFRLDVPSWSAVTERCSVRTRIDIPKEPRRIELGAA